MRLGGDLAPFAIRAAAVLVMQPFEYGQGLVLRIVEPRRILPVGAVAPARAAVGRDPIWLPIDDADAAGIDCQLGEVDHVAALAFGRRRITGDQRVIA